MDARRSGELEWTWNPVSQLLLGARKSWHVPAAVIAGLFAVALLGVVLSGRPSALGGLLVFVPVGLCLLALAASGPRQISRR